EELPDRPSIVCGHRGREAASLGALVGRSFLAVDDELHLATLRREIREVPAVGAEDGTSSVLVPSERATVGDDDHGPECAIVPPQPPHRGPSRSVPAEDDALWMQARGRDRATRGDDPDLPPAA